MISYTTGDLLKSEAQALVNTVNTEGVMGKGLALQFKSAFPENYKIYRNACKKGQFSVGQMLITEEIDIFGNRKLIINFPTNISYNIIIRCILFVNYIFYCNYIIFQLQIKFT